MNIKEKLINSAKKKELIYHGKFKSSINEITLMLLDFISPVAELKAVMMYSPASRLMLSLEAPFLSVVRLYITP